MIKSVYDLVVLLDVVFKPESSFVFSPNRSWEDPFVVSLDLQVWKFLGSFITPVTAADEQIMG
ncbi:hypothetical protein SAMD00023353_4100100 [Rosellinia necatrix]|uniref:Uncharacterized protein n=1 Tax=Rosellinia necatrix TaxID=77044 RepID=A0A1S8AAB8_ROSNE|nr:hypothetical protein SAMD00023353_4100100 [Rosellinia necatrix]